MFTQVTNHYDVSRNAPDPSAWAMHTATNITQTLHSASDRHAARFVLVVVVGAVPVVIWVFIGSVKPVHDDSFMFDP